MSMKLLFCDDCHDIVRLYPEMWRRCKCGKIGGQYNIDWVTATVGGQARVFGIANPFFGHKWVELESQAKEELRTKYYPEGQGQDIWWGNYEGDVQLFTIHSPRGPRLRCRSTLVIPDTTIKGEVVVTVSDRRKYYIGGELRRKEVTIPFAAGMCITYKPSIRLANKILQARGVKEIIRIDKSGMAIAERINEPEHGHSDSNKSEERVSS